MHHRNRQPTHSRLKLHIKNGAIHIVTVGVRAVQQQHLAIIFCTGIHQTAHRNVVCIETQTHILDIYYQDVEFTHRSITWLLVFTIIKRKNRYTGLGVHRAFYMLSSIRISSETMFRRKNGNYVEFILKQNIQKMLVAYHSRMIGKDSDPFSFENWEIFGCLFGTHYHTIILCLTPQCKAQHHS